MANYNKVILIGNLTRDPELSYLPNSQTPVVELGIATNRRWRSQNGEMREDTCFVDCRAYGRQAETINQYMSKGRQIMVEGRLHYSQWEAQDGSRRSKLRVVVENFQFLDSGQGGGGRDSSGASSGGYNQDRGGGGGGYNRGGGGGQQRRQGPSNQGPSDSHDEPTPPDYDDGGGADDIPF
ncbi:MAG: single-stranded DNA-binding protein [Phycisphaerae bacterium]